MTQYGGVTVVPEDPPIPIFPMAEKPRNIYTTVVFDRDTLKRVKRAARQRKVGVSTVVYELVKAGLPGLETDGAERRSGDRRRTA